MKLMRQFKNTRERPKFDNEKVTKYLNETLVIKGFSTEDTKFGEIILIETDKGILSTFSKVLQTQLEEQEKIGFPFQAKIAQVNNYYTFTEP